MGSACLFGALPFKCISDCTSLPLRCCNATPLKAKLCAPCRADEVIVSGVEDIGSRTKEITRGEGALLARLLFLLLCCAVLATLGKNERMLFHSEEMVRHSFYQVFETQLFVSSTPPQCAGAYAAVDCVGGDLFAQMAAAVRDNGTVYIYGVMSGFTVRAGKLCKKVYSKVPGQHPWRG